MTPTGISMKQVQISTANIGPRTRKIAHLYMETKQVLNIIRPGVFHNSYKLQLFQSTTPIFYC